MQETGGECLRPILQSQIQKAFLQREEHALYAELLGVVCRALQSTHGFIGYIDASGRLVCPAITPGWGGAALDEKPSFAPENWTGFWRRSLVERRVLWTNGEASAAGDVPVQCALAGPVVYHDTLIGQIGVANRSAGYSDADALSMHEIAELIAPLLQARLMSERAKGEALAELRLREEDYRQLGEDFQALLAAVPDEVALLRSDLTVLWSNRFPDLQAAVRNGGVGGKCWEVFCFTQDVCSVCPAAQTMQTAAPASGIVTYPNGRIYEVRAAPIPRSDGRLRGIVRVARDITERRRLEQQLLQAQKMESVGRLTSSIAHDFNNLLTVIAGNLELARLLIPQGHPAERKLVEIAQSSERAAELIRQLLVFSRRQVIDPKVVDLRLLIERMRRILERVLGEDVQLRVELPPTPALVRVDVGQIEQVLLNVAVNAKDAMPRGGTLSVSLQPLCSTPLAPQGAPDLPPGPYHLLGVSDTGEGMPPEVCARAFEPFFTTKPPGVGTGLGLAMVDGAIAQHGGRVVLESREGQGTVLRIYLPASSATAADPEPVPAAPDRLADGAGLLLVVEDEAMVRNLSVHLLSSAGYEVLAAASGEDALTLVREGGRRIDVLVSDVIMPGMDGAELAERLRAVQPTLRVLFISGYPESLVTERRALMPGVAFLRKPFTAAELTQRVRAMLQNGA